MKKILHHLCKEKKINVPRVLEPKIRLDENFKCRRLRFENLIANCNNEIWCLPDDSVHVIVLVDDEQFLHM